MAMLSSKAFTFLGNVATAEISTFGSAFKWANTTGGGRGFTMVSSRTRKRVWFKVVQVHKDDDGDIVYWECRAYAGHGNLPPGAAGLIVKIFND